MEGQGAETAAGRFSGGVHRMPLRIYWEDTDAGGIVYHASYIRFFERGRTEFLRALGCSQSLLQSEGVRFVVAHMDVSYKTPAMLDDFLQISTRCAVLGHAKLVLQQLICLNEKPLVSAKVTCAAINDANRPVRLPEALSQRLKAMQESDS